MTQTDEHPSETALDHTEAKAALRESEERFRVTFEQAAVGIAHISSEGRFLRINQAFCDLVGYTHDEMLALTFQEITHPDDLDTDLDNAARLWGGETDIFSREKRYLHKNGEIVWVNLMVSLVRGDSGEPRWAVAVAQDITARKTMEKALTKSEERYRALSGASFEAVFISEKGVCIEQNATAEKMFGYTSAEAIGRNGTEWIVPEDREMVIGNMLSGHEGRYEATALRKDGSTFPAEIQARMMHFDERTVRVTALTDHTEHKLAEKALLESEAKFRTLVTNTEEIVYVIAEDGTFLLSEGKGLSRLGVNPGDVVGQSVFELYSDYPDMLAAMRRALHGETTTTETWVAGECFRNWYSPHVNAEGETVLLGLSVNITEQKQAEIKLQEYQGRLRALAAELTLSEERERRRIAVELHDHVAQSLSMARVQIASAMKAAADTEMVARLDEVSQSLLQAVHDTRDIMYDLSSPSIDEFGLGAAISDWLENRMPPQDDLRINFTADELNTPLDDDSRAILFRSVKELLTNVIKHARAESVSVRMESDRDALRIVVEDDGVGFDAHDHAHAGRDEGGFGLFSISERMADLGGRLEIDSRPGRGCRAFLVIPNPKQNPGGEVQA